jgi:N-acyl homoserine lactone hydrolase
MLKRAALSLTFITLAACGQPQQEEAAAPAVQLYAMDCGHAAFTNLAMFADDGVTYEGEARTLVDPCYLIRHPNGDLLWDTGFNDAIADMPDGLQIDAIGARVTMPVKLADQLAQLQLTPADIEFVSISHMHSDHTGNLNAFAAGSTWIVDADERAAMFSPEGRADAQGFSFYNQLENVRTQLIEGGGDYDVFGDGSVVIVQAPGHTPGHTILKVTLPTAGVVLLTGDMWHLPESRANRRVPRFNTDRAQTLASTDKIEAIAAETNARVIRQHVREDFAALPAFPQPLE